LEKSVFNPFKNKKLESLKLREIKKEKERRKTKNFLNVIDLTGFLVSERSRSQNL